MKHHFLLVSTWISLLVSGWSWSAKAATPPEEPPKGLAAETWTFWEAMNKAAVAGTGMEVLNTPAWSGDVSTDETVAVLGDIVAAERTRSHAITGLPVLHVDPYASAYAVELAQMHDVIADYFQDCIAFLKRRQDITSLSTLGGGMILNLLNHHDDKEDGIFARALLDQADQTATDLKSLKEPARLLEEKANRLVSSAATLSTDQFAVRAKLAQRFDREFPTMATYFAAAEAGLAAKPNRFSEKELMPMLIGQRITTPAVNWKFASPQEFVTFKIVDVKDRSDVLTDYSIQTHVKGIPSGAEHDFKLRMTFGKLYTRWKLVEIQQLQ